MDGYYAATPQQSALFGDIERFAPQRLSKRVVEKLYRIPLFRNVCNEMPTSAAGGGWTIGFGGETEDAAKINSELSDYEMRVASLPLGETVPETPTKSGGTPRSFASLFKSAQIYANLYRGAVILMNIEDGRPASEPVDMENIQSLRRLAVLDCYKIMPVIKGGIDPSFPVHYQLVFGEQSEMMAMTGGKKDKPRSPFGDSIGLIHHSRILRFNGIGLPSDMALESDGWGMSLIEGILKSYLRFIRAADSAAKSVENHKTLVMKIDGLNDMIRRRNTVAIQDRLTYNKMFMELLGAIACDAKEEDISYLSAAFAGLEGTVNILRDIFIGESDISHDRLFGESPSGLGATGESERLNWAENVASFENNEWKPLLYWLYKIVFLAKDGPTGGKLPEGWEVQFKSLIQQTEEQKATVQKTQSDSDLAYLEKGVITKKEARSRLSSPGYEAGIMLDDSEWEKEQKAAEEQQKQQQEAMAAAQQQQPPGQPPNANGKQPPQPGQPPNGKQPVAGAGKPPALIQPKAVQNSSQKTNTGKPPAFAGRKDREDGEAMFIEYPGIYQVALGEAQNTFKNQNSEYLHRFAAIRYEELVKALLSSTISPEEWVEIDADGEILGPMNADSVRSLPADKAQQMTRGERLAATQPEMRLT
ncbi:MAG TPA: anti-CBASS Acb1 family protein [Trichocoleus sp.]